MTTPLLYRCLTWTLFAVLPLAAAGKPKPAPDHWVATWAAPQMAQPVSAIVPGPGVLIPGAADTTLRQIVHTSLGGSLLRLELSNALGTEPLTIGAVHVALADARTDLPGHPTGDLSLLTANALTFAGNGPVTIPAGAQAISDAFALTLPANADLVITLFLPAQQITTATYFPGALQTNFFAPGNVVSQRSLAMPATGFQPMAQDYFLKCVDVQAPAAAGTIVAFGDSITEGYGSTPNSNQRWPNLLANRLTAQAKAATPAGADQKSAAGDASPAGQTLAVVDEGIGGNRILHDVRGPSALARFERDALDLPGVRYVVLLEGINDIGVAYNPSGATGVVTAEQLIAGLTQLAEQAHTHGVKVIGATLTPYLGAGYSSPAGEAVRVALNTWIRSTPVFDGVIDFDRITQDPAHPTTLNPAYDHGDHLHPSDAGYKAMADGINLALFGK